MLDVTPAERLCDQLRALAAPPEERLRSLPPDSLRPYTHELSKCFAPDVFKVLSALHSLRDVSLNFGTKARFEGRGQVGYDDGAEYLPLFFGAWRHQKIVKDPDADAGFLLDVQHLDIVRVDRWFWTDRLRLMKKLKTLRIRNLEVHPMEGLIAEHMCDSMGLREKPHLSLFSFTVWGHRFSRFESERRSVLQQLAKLLPRVVLEPKWV